MFLAWQQESTLHRVAVIRLQAVWQRADRLQALGAGVPRGNIPAPGQWATRQAPELRSRDSISRAVGIKAWVRGRHKAIGASLVAAVAALVIGVFISIDTTTYRTAVSENQVVHLSDGSRVTLNTDSRIHVSLTASERRIDLQRGEVFFEVSKDPSRPFVVYADGRRVTAVGTKFSVMRMKDDLRVVVTEGKVRVADGAPDNVAPAVELTAGNIARISDAGVLVREISIPEAEQSLSWRSGFVMFRATALAEAVAEFNRYNERQLVLADPELAEFRIGGHLRLTNLDAFVRMLEQEYPIRASREDDRIVLSRR
jgi:transmembrane sensor